MAAMEDMGARERSYRSDRGHRTHPRLRSPCPSWILLRSRTWILLRSQPPELCSPLPQIRPSLSQPVLPLQLLSPTLLGILCAYNGIVNLKNAGYQSRFVERYALAR